MSPFEILGLDRGADEASIKRAYARLLRRHRPDEDPAGFQALHEAYAACLQQARWRAEGWDFDADDEADEADDGPDAPDAIARGVDGLDHPPMFAQAEDATALVHDESSDRFEPARQDDTWTPNEADAEDADGFDSDAFAAELAERMRTLRPQALEDWLQAHDDLYSLDRKHAVQPLVVHVLDEAATSDAARHFEGVTRFFGLDTIAGADAWLHHQLDAIQRRFGDAADFQRVLRAHAGPDASWTDRAIVRELRPPARWLRRLCLLACPGLPGRVGALSRALHAADPEAAASELDPAARTFWEGLTDRRTLSRMRIGAMLFRAAAWSLVVTLLLHWLGDKDADTPFAIDSLWLFGIGFGIWLAYALVVAGLIRFRDFNQTRMQWDWVLLVTAGGLGCGAVAAWLGASPAIPLGMTAIFWIGARHSGGEGWSPTQFAALLSGLAGFGLALLVLQDVAGDRVAIGLQACVAALFAFGTQLLHDVVLCKVRGIDLQAARAQPGWLWPMFGVQVLALFVASMLA